MPKNSIYGLDALGVALQALGLFDEAKERFQQGLTLIRDGNFRSWIPLWLYRLGKVNFQTGNFVRAERQFQNSLTLAFEFDQLELGALNHNALGILCFVENDYLKVREHLQSALETAMPLGRPPLLLSIFATAAELFAEEGDPVYAALLAFSVTNHSASEAKVKDRANQLLTRLEAELHPNDLQKIRLRSQQSDLDSLAAQLVIDLEKQ